MKVKLETYNHRLNKNYYIFRLLTYNKKKIQYIATTKVRLVRANRKKVLRL